MVKYICDCCGEEVENKKCLRSIEFIGKGIPWNSNLKTDLVKKDVCKKCYLKYVKECGLLFYKLQKERSENNG